MKRINILIVFLIFSSMSLSAQRYSSRDRDVESMKVQKFRFGVKAGLNLSSIEGGESYNYNPRLGFYLGIVEEFYVTNEISIQPEILYSNQGGTDQDHNSVKYRLDYLSLPLMIKLYVSDKYSFHLGPQFSYNIYSKGSYIKNSEIINDFSEANKFDFGFNMGFGVEITDNMAVNARYHWGITEIRDKKDDRNMLLQLGVSFKI